MDSTDARLEAVRSQSLSTRAALGDVVVFSREEQARQQRVFTHVMQPPLIWVGAEGFEEVLAL